MRFHVGFSFRLKTLKKFLIPILLGILSYFGLSYFNLTIVKAYGNLDSYYNLEVDEVDFSQYDIFDYNMQDLLDYSFNDYENFYVNTRVYIQGNSYAVSFALYPKNANNPNVGIYNNKGSSSGSSMHIQSYDYSYQSFYSYYLSTYDENEFHNVYDRFIDCLYTDYCLSSDMSSQYDLPSYYTDTNVNNYDSYNINVFYNNYEGGYYYNNQLPVINYQSNISDNWFYVKSIRVNNVEVPFYDFIPSYCELYSCSSNNDNVNFELVSNRILYTYTNFDTNDLNDINFHYSYGVEDLNTYLDNYNDYYYFYGRVNHSNNYYSYEPINCSINKTFDNDFDLNYFSLDIDNFTCSSSLTNYDKLFFMYGVNFNDENISKTIKASIITSNVSFIYDYYRGRIYDNFDNLSTDFSFVISSQSLDNKYSIVNLKTNNNYVVYSDISNVNSTLNIDASGNLFQNCVIGEFCQVEFYNNNLLIYNDETYNNSFNTNLGIILNNENFIISFSNNNNYYYYDDSNNIVNNDINYTYNNTINDSYNLTYYFNQINSFIDSLDSDLYNFHNILDSIYSNIPLFIQSFIFAVYLLFLTYLLFRFIRK